MIIWKGYNKFTIMKKYLILLIFCLPLFTQAQNNSVEIQVAATLDTWHQAAANAYFDKYFSMMAKDAVFIGTDPNEHWTKTQFMAYAKPHFDKGKVWSFSALKRHIYLSKNQKTAWFDELLDTHMGICRGSGILIKTNSGWKIQQYVLSVTIPNTRIDAVKKLKKAQDAEISASQGH